MIIQRSLRLKISPRVRHLPLLYSAPNRYLQIIVFFLVKRKKMRPLILDFVKFHNPQLNVVLAIRCPLFFSMGANVCQQPMSVSIREDRKVPPFVYIQKLTLNLVTNFFCVLCKNSFWSLIILRCIFSRIFHIYNFYRTFFYTSIYYIDVLLRKIEVMFPGNESGKSFTLILFLYCLTFN